MAISKDLLKALRVDIDAALAEVGKKHGVSLTQGNTRYSVSTFTTKIEGIVLNSSSTGTTSTEQAKYTSEAPICGIDPASYGKSFIDRGTKFKIVGINRKAKKYPIIAQNDNGTRYKFGPEVVAEAA